MHDTNTDIEIYGEALLLFKTFYNLKMAKKKTVKWNYHSITILLQYYRMTISTTYFKVVAVKGCWFFVKSWTLSEIEKVKELSNKSHSKTWDFFEKCPHEWERINKRSYRWKNRQNRTCRTIKYKNTNFPVGRRTYNLFVDNVLAISICRILL